jgi:hypothetical protein
MNGGNRADRLARAYRRGLQSIEQDIADGKLPSIYFDAIRILTSEGLGEETDFDSLAYRLLGAMSNYWDSVKG